MAKIVYTKTDEAPALATQSFLPIVRRFLKTAGIDVELKDISLAGRILANFPDSLTADQKTEDALSLLGKLAKTPEANIIKLPNISASVPQLKAAIAELQEQGFHVPDFPEDPQTDTEKETRARYAKVLGSAVNPVLREGNSDRRVAKAVKEYAKAHPHSMGVWASDSGSTVASMSEGDFYGSEQSTVIENDTTVNINLMTSAGETQTLKKDLSLLKGEVIDCAVMSQSKLRQFLTDQVKFAKDNNLLFSVHLKATMMKVSDPILFGQALEVYFADVFAKYAPEFKKAGVDSRYGLGDLYKKIENLPNDTQKEIKQDLTIAMEHGPDLAMVDSDKGITNLHVPSDVIIDASMPAAIRSSGQMWNKDGKLQDMLAIIPDRCYSGIYQATIDFCKKHGAFDPAKMGSVANVGLMAKKAEEYGSHDKTFWIENAGKVQVVDASGTVLMEQDVAPGDIFRMCQTKDVAIRDWVSLAIRRARLSKTPVVFWLDKNRAHDRNLIAKLETYIKDEETSGIDWQILAPTEATEMALQQVKDGQDCIAATGNVLRDYLTDLFPILELGTSAKMLSIVPLLAGGGLFETGAGGSAPKHVQQFVKENHLRWDSLGEFLALAVSLEDIAEKSGDTKVRALAEGLNTANQKFLQENKSPSRKVGELDNRGSHFYLCLYWAQAMSKQKTDAAMAELFTPLANQLIEKETVIVNELNIAQGKPVDMKGYYRPDDATVAALMRPSSTFNETLEVL